MAVTLQRKRLTVARHSSDEPNPIGEWFRVWRKPVRDWLSRRAAVPAREVDDLLQEVFLRLLRYSQDTPVNNPFAYLLRIANSVACEWRLRCQVSRPHESQWLEDLLIEAHLEPEHHVDRDQRARVIQGAILALSPRQQRVLRLRMEAELTQAEIAAALALRPRIVLRDLNGAYRKLRRYIQIEDITLNGW
jgi:RNA polymerase sigma-70 factor (ECF subfamily)